MNVDLFEDDKVVFEDVGHREDTMLANESILMRGLVVRSHSNQISIHFHSLKSQTGSVILRYQGKSELQSKFHLPAVEIQLIWVVWKIKQHEI